MNDSAPNLGLVHHQRRSTWRYRIVIRAQRDAHEGKRVVPPSGAYTDWTSSPFYLLEQRSALRLTPSHEQIAGERRMCPGAERVPPRFSAFNTARS
jgi:hypothetical protein